MYVIKHKVGHYLANTNPVRYCDDVEDALLFDHACEAYDTIEHIYAFPNVVEVVSVEVPNDTP